MHIDGASSLAVIDTRAMTAHWGFLHSVRKYALPFVIFFIYFASITVLQRTPWFDLGIDYTIWMAFAWAGFALLCGFILNRPSTISIGFLLGCLTPFHRVAVVMALITAFALLVRTLIKNRGQFVSFFRNAIQQRGFGWILLISGYAITVWLIRIGDSTDVWSLVALASSLFMVPATAYALTYLPWSDTERNIAIRWSGLAVAALGAIVLLYPAVTGQWIQYRQALYVVHKALQSVNIEVFSIEWINPDYNIGSLRSAHFMSVVMLAPAFSLSAYAFVRRKLVLFLYSIPFWYLFLLGENAHAFSGIIMATIVVFLFLRRGVVRRPAFHAMGIVVMVLIAAVLSINWFYGAIGYFHTSPKAKTYAYSLKHVQQHPGRLILGEGPAAFSSYASRKRLPGYLTDDTPFPFIPGYANPHYAAVLELAHEENTSSTINRAFSGFLGLFMEWGLIGSALLITMFSILLRNVIKASCASESLKVRGLAIGSVAMFIIVFSMLPFRPYLEYPDTMAVVSVMYALVLMPINRNKPETVQ